jgi:hypothetical protein
MTPEQFCYWLRGFDEIQGVTPNEEQWEIIKEHLRLVFQKVTVTPNFDDLLKNRKLTKLAEQSCINGEKPPTVIC